MKREGHLLEQELVCNTRNETKCILYCVYYGMVLIDYRQQKLSIVLSLNDMDGVTDTEDVCIDGL